jgi:AhpD family alkylhydroperoxidase
MTAKIDLFVAAPSLMKDWQRTSIALAAAANFDPTLTELVKLRASQINGCANCINLHATEARENGETEQRIYLLPAWREAPCYSDRERAALGWTEALTRLSEGHGHRSAYEALKALFTEEEQVKLTLTINIINGWNRIAVGFSTPMLQPSSLPRSRRLRNGGREIRGRNGRFRPAASQAAPAIVPHAWCLYAGRRPLSWRFRSLHESGEGMGSGQLRMQLRRRGAEGRVGDRPRRPAGSADFRGSADGCKRGSCHPGQRRSIGGTAGRRPIRRHAADPAEAQTQSLGAEPGRNPAAAAQSAAEHVKSGGTFAFRADTPT